MEKLLKEQGNIWILSAQGHNGRNYQSLLGQLGTIELFFTLEQIIKGLNSPNRPRPSTFICELDHHDFESLDEIFSRLEDAHVMVISKDNSRTLMKKTFNAGVTDFFVSPVNDNILFSKVEYYLGHEDTSNRDLGHFTSGIRLDGREIRDLTTKQVQLLALFIKSRTRTVSREDILDQIWENIQVHPKVVDVHIYNLRRKLSDFGFMIKSRGRGNWSLLSTQQRQCLIS